jgi:SOS-response transcriptional repressor LexA
MSQDTTIRPTKKQKQILDYVEGFILEHGYSPSYREIMVGTGNSSVATVAVHINNLISRGHLAKREHSARSLEVIKDNGPQASKLVVKQVNESQAKWLIEKVEVFFKDAENAVELSAAELDKLYVLIGSLKVLGLEGAAQSFMPRLTILKKKIESAGGGVYA